MSSKSGWMATEPPPGTIYVQSAYTHTLAVDEYEVDGGIKYGPRWDTGYDALSSETPLRDTREEAEKDLEKHMAELGWKPKRQYHKGIETES